MLFSKETLKSYAASKGISQVEDSAYQLLSQDLEYRIKELCQEASKFMSASHRTKLSIEDINYALISRNIDPLFGYDPTESLSFKSINNFFYIPDEECDIEDYLNKPLPKIPLKPTIHAHWLAIEGVQPQIPQNPLPAEKKQRTVDVLQNYMEEAEIKANSKHILSKELQLYFDKINAYIAGTEDENALALDCMEKDTGIQQLIPYFIQSFSETISSKKNTGNVVLIMAMIFSLLKNKFIYIDPYLHLILPPVLTGVLGSGFDDKTREVSSHTLKFLFEKYSGCYNSLAPRILKTLKISWLDPEKPEEIQYSALKCLSILGENVINDVIKENKDKYLNNKPHKIVTELLNSIIGN